MRVSSWNILAPCYVRVPGQPWNAFTHCSDAELDWDSRRRVIQEYIATCSADVLALQEVVFEKRASCAADGATSGAEWRLPLWLEEACTRAGLTGVMQGLKQKDLEGNAKRNLKHVGHATPTGLATLYRHERFALERSAHGSGSGSVLFLTDRSSQARVTVCNTHLVGDPAKADSQLVQLNGLLKNMNTKRGSGGSAGSAGTCGACPVARRVICGDFNGECEAGSAVHAWMAREAFREAATPASWAEPGSAQRLDHVLFEADERRGLRLQEAEGGCVARLVQLARALAGVEEVAQEPEREPEVATTVGTAGKQYSSSCSMMEAGLPSRWIPSDHTPVEVVLTVLPAAAAEEPPASPAASATAASTMSAAEMCAAAEEVDALQAQAPDAARGKPSAELLEQLQAHRCRLAGGQVQHGAGGGVRGRLRQGTQETPGRGVQGGAGAAGRGRHVKK